MENEREQRASSGAGWITPAGGYMSGRSYSAGAGELLARRVGQRVKELRRLRGWTQSDLAQRMAAVGVEMHQTTVAKMESASRPVSLVEVASLAEVFDIEVEQLLAEPSGLASDFEEVRAAKRTWTQAVVATAQLRAQLQAAETAEQEAEQHYQRLVASRALAVEELGGENVYVGDDDG